MMNGTLGIAATSTYTQFRPSNGPYCATPSCRTAISPGQAHYTACEGCQNRSPPSLKRKRGICIPLAGPSNIDKAMREASENEKTQAEKQFQNRAELIEALRERFAQVQHVDFNGSYHTVDAEVAHKQQIQTITHEIWKATGYRFTVKDHPRIKDGHKTRLWCSQDEAHKSKAKGAIKPRISSTGEALAKARYPCRSRLFISSRDADTSGRRLITVRLHHHISHEPYYDASVPPEVTKAMWDRMGWLGTANDTPTTTPVKAVKETEKNEAEGMSDDEGFDEESRSGDVRVDVYEGEHNRPHVQPEPAPVLPDPSVPPIDPEKYQERMRQHIHTIRDFCDGLEYQLQFNDCRMLDALEREGASFLRLVQECLEREGRLTSRGSSSEAIVEQ